MRSEDERLAAQAQTLDDLRRMAMLEDVIGSEALAHFDEMRRRGGRLPCPRYTRLGIADDRLLEIDQLRLE